MSETVYGGVSSMCDVSRVMKAGVQPGGAESPISVSFAGGDAGGWRVDRIDEVRGQGLESVSRLAVVEGGADTFFRSGARWVLLGVTSHDRYSTAGERQRLLAAQAPLGRPEATRAALIPIKKSEDWWALTHDERRAIFEERSHHIATSLDYLPTIARRLHHSRDLGQPFDFLTWFEYAPTAVDGFEELVRRLRMSDEWTFVEREIDIRLTREPSAINRSG